MTRALLCLLALKTTALAAQQPSFVGAWQVAYPLGARVENGNVTPQMATGVLTIVTQADSLVGTLVMDSTPEMPPMPARRLVAKAGAGEATFVSRSEVTLFVNFDERKATMINIWNLTIKGDSISGTVERTLEGFGAADQGPLPAVTGSRQKG